MTSDVTKPIAWLDDAGALAGALVGGKFSSLAELASAGFGVPPAFAVTTQALTAFLETSGLDAEARAVQEGAGAGDLVQQRIVETPLPAAIESAVTGAYARLCEQAGTPDLPVAVRSSGVAEDLAGASFAGQYETYLWVRGAESVCEHVRRCWTGLFGEAVRSYRPGGGAGGAGMAVVVQQLVQPRAAGVMFTLDPVNGDRSKIVIEGSWGLGEAVVGGEVTPDRFRVDKVTLDVLERVVSAKEVEYRFADGTVAALPVPEERRARPCLADDDVVALAKLAKRIEQHRGAPQDVEWAIDDAGRVHVLQVRPETVWSRREARSVSAAGRSALDLVLGTFVSGGRLDGEARE